MQGLGRILLVDDEDVFRASTSELLRKAGFDCDSSPDVPSAKKLLDDDGYDLLILDVRMPGNEDLQFVRELPESAHAVPIIIVTGYPSIETAVESLRLRVANYFVKPFDFDELLQDVKLAVERSKSQRTMRKMRSKMNDWTGQMKELDKAMDEGESGELSTHLDQFVNVASRNIISAVLDLSNLTHAIATDEETSQACQILNCPRMVAMEETVRDAIEVLEGTRSSFKSKELGQLRLKLEAALKTNG